MRRGFGENNEIFFSEERVSRIRPSRAENTNGSKGANKASWEREGCLQEINMHMTIQFQLCTLCTSIQCYWGRQTSWAAWVDPDSETLREKLVLNIRHSRVGRKRAILWIETPITLHAVLKCAISSSFNSLPLHLLTETVRKLITTLWHWTKMRIIFWSICHMFAIAFDSPYWSPCDTYMN